MFCEQKTNILHIKPTIDNNIHRHMDLLQYVVSQEREKEIPNQIEFIINKKYDTIFFYKFHYWFNTALNEIKITFKYCIFFVVPIM